MRGLWRALAAGLAVPALALTAVGAHAGALAVSPVLVEVVAQAEAATSVTVFNKGTTPINVQARVLRWTQDGGRDNLQPTSDVVASPPIARVGPGQEQLIRIVRLSKTPIVGEEAYRLLVDELPSAGIKSAGTVSLVLRQALAVFFKSPAAEARALEFSVVRERSGTMLRATNRGAIHHRLTELDVRDGGGRTVSAKSGLVGYVIGGSSYSWPVQGLSGGSGRVTGRSNLGTIDASVAAR